MLRLDYMLNIHRGLPLKWNLPVLETATTFSTKEADVICQSECHCNTNDLSCLYWKRKQAHVKQWGMEDKMWLENSKQWPEKNEENIYYWCILKSLLCRRGGVTFYRNSADEWSSVCELSFLAARETCYVLLYYTAIKGCGNITILQI